MTDKNTKPCKRLGADSTKNARALAHAVKMRVKKKLNAHNANRLLEHPEFVLANQSVKHDNYGETPAEQSKRMLEKSS